jgi:hypothetical protein
MKLNYKLLFWISLALLGISNLFWGYHMIDVAIGHNYYSVSCEEYQVDRLEFKKVLDSKKTKAEALDFLKSYHIKYDSIEKGSEFIITLSSFDMVYNQQGDLIESTTR